MTGTTKKARFRQRVIRYTEKHGAAEARYDAAQAVRQSANGKMSGKYCEEFFHIDL